jgi:hypothetical protein
MSQPRWIRFRRSNKAAPVLLLLRLGCALLICSALLLPRNARAQGLDMGIPELRAANPAMTGSGVSILQVEAIFTGNNDWEVDPGSVNQPVSNFTYISGSGTSTTYPNDLGIASGHANSVADNLYGDTNTSDPEGIAYGISHVYNYEADYYANDLVINNGGPSPAEIVNQSFIFIGTTSSDQMQLDQGYDNYADTYGTLFVDGAGNGGQVSSPASAYNCIAVGDYMGNSSSGNYDGRSKPDIVAYTPSEPETSFATPCASGAAAILLQAAQEGLAGTSAQTESDAGDARVLKALLLNGATKTPGWKSTVADPETTPLDPVTGAGLLNVDNSYLNLIAGEHPSSATTAGPAAALSSGSLLPAEGWDLNTLANTGSNGTYLDESAHYLVDLSGPTGSTFTLTATLIWWIELNQDNINNFYLYLFDSTTGQELDASLSTIDNVQEIYIQNLPPGDYDLAVTKSATAMVSQTDTYALAYNFETVPEPSTALLLLPGAALLALARRRRF